MILEITNGELGELEDESHALYEKMKGKIKLINVYCLFLLKNRKVIV